VKNIIFIAEIGINHNGDLNIAKKLIDNSKKAGFDFVKFQKRDVLTVYSKEILDAPRESPWGTTTREQKFGLEFEKKQYDEIDAYCKKINICCLKETETLRVGCGEGRGGRKDVG
jgi:N-acetylneuraminate synthase